MQKGTVDLQIENGIGTIEFHHPKGNSLPGRLLESLTNLVTEAGDEESAEVLVIRSKGDGAFCGGASLIELQEISDLNEGTRYFMGFAKLFNAMRKCPKLIITRVHGKTVGGGIGFAAMADYTFAHRSASIKLSELALGIGPFVVEPAIKRRIGISSFSTLALDAHTWHDSEWAEEKGLFNRVLPDMDSLDEAVDKLSTELSNSNPESNKELKKIMWQNTGHWETTLEQRAELSGRLVLSDFAKAYLEKFI